MDRERTAERFHAFHHAEQPEALAPRGLDVESHAIVADGHREPAGAPAQVHRHFTRLAVLDCILYSFLNDPEQAQHQIWRQRRWHVVVAETGGDADARQIEAQLVDGGDEAEELQLRRMEAVRKLVQALGYALRHRQGLRGTPLSIIGAVQRFELNRQHEHPLADVVVELACDAGTLAFLGAQQTRREIAVALIAPEQLALARPQLSFRLPPSPALDQQPGNQDALREEQSGGADDVAFVTVSDRWIAKPDERAG